MVYLPNVRIYKAGKVARSRLVFNRHWILRLFLTSVEKRRSGESYGLRLGALARFEKNLVPLLIRNDLVVQCEQPYRCYSQQHTIAFTRAKRRTQRFRQKISLPFPYKGPRSFTPRIRRIVEYLFFLQDHQLHDSLSLSPFSGGSPPVTQVSA